MKNAPRKLSLSLDALQVETFSTREDTDPRRGTVNAHAEETDPVVCNRTLQNEYTCYNTCECLSWSGAECKNGCIG